MAKHQQAALDELAIHHDRAVEELRASRADLKVAQEHGRAETVRADTLAADTEKLLARITGLEGIIRGLRDERSLWSRELVPDPAVLLALLAPLTLTMHRRQRKGHISPPIVERWNRKLRTLMLSWPRLERPPQIYKTLCESRQK